MNVKEIARETIIILLLLIFPISLFSAVKGPISGTDLETPISHDMYLWEVIHPYTLNDLVRDTLPNLYVMFYWLIALISSGNILISQFILLTVSLFISYIGSRCLLLFLGFKRNLASIIAIIYALNPAYLAWFTLPLILSASFIPWCGYFTLRILDILSHEPINLKYLFKLILYNAFCYGFLTTLFYHYSLYMLLIFVIFWILIRGKESVYGLLTNIKFLIFTISVSIVLLIALNPRIIEISRITLDSGNAFDYSLVAGTERLIASLRENFSFIRLLTYSYGSPSEAIFDALFAKSIMFVPFVLMEYLPLVIIRYLSHTQRRLYITSLVMSLLIDFLIIALIYIRPSYLSNRLLLLIIATLRRPERMLSYFKLLFNIIMVLISINNIDKYLLFINKIKTFHYDYSNRDLNIKVKYFVAICLVVLYILYVGIPYDVTSESFTQHYVRIPDMYISMNNIYHKLFKSNNELILYRYFTSPLYSPWSSFLWKNYPNLLYSSTFASDSAKTFYSLLINSIVNGNRSSVLLLKWSGTKYIIIPINGTEDLQGWRCRGKPRVGPSGVHLFGDPRLYEKLFDKLLHNVAHEKYKYKSLIVYRIATSPSIYVPQRILIIKNETIIKSLDMFLDLYPDLINESLLLIGYDNLIPLNISTINITDRTIAVIIDLENQIMTTIDSIHTRIKENIYKISTYTFTRNDLLIWANQYSIEENNNSVKISLSMLNKPGSIWIRIRNPFTNITQDQFLKINITIKSKMLNTDLIKTMLIDMEGNQIETYSITKKQNDSIQAALYAPATNRNALYVKIVLYPANNLTKLDFDIASNVNLSLVSFSPTNNDTCISGRCFVVVGNKLYSLYNSLLSDIQSLLSKITFGKVALLSTTVHQLPIHLNNSDLEYSVEVLSPEDIKIHFHNIRSAKIIPLFIGFTSNNWRLNIESNECINDVTPIENANLYGKLWILYVNRNCNESKSSIVASLYYDKNYLFVHRVIFFVQAALTLTIVVTIFRKLKNRCKI